MRQLSYSYQRIFNIALPLILGNLAYSAIGFADMYFMKFVGPIEQGAISYVGHLYTTIFIMGYAYCKGVQILVANQVGANALHKVGAIVDHAMITLLAMAMFLLLLVDQFGLTLLSALLNTPEAIEASWDYLSIRKIGFGFSFLGCAMLAMYSGIERTKILAVAIASMSITNIFLNWVLVFGKFGFEPMGIRGAAWASNIAEVVSLAVFIGGLLYQRLIPRLKIFHFKPFSRQLFSQINWTSLPLIFQAIVALTTWFLFFTLVERKLGSTAWAASGPVKNLYTLFGVTSYAFASTTNTAIGNLVGKEAYDEIIPTIKRMIRLSLLVAIGVTIPVILMPRTLLLWITTPELVEVGLTTLYVSLGSLWIYSIGTILFNAIVGLGQTSWSLVIEVLSCIGFIAFLILLFYGVNCTSLAWGWSSEIVYWLLTGGLGLAWFKWFFPKVIEQIKES